MPDRLGLAAKRSDTVGEITTRRQKPLVLRIMVEQGRTMILFLFGLTPRCAQIFPHRCCFQPVRRFRQQMGRAQAPTIMERKWVRPAVPDRREPGAGPSGRPYFRSRWAARRRPPSWRGNGCVLPCRTGVSPGLDRAVDPISAAVSVRDLVLLSWDMMSASVVQLERQGGPPRLDEGRPPTPPRPQRKPAHQP